MFKFKNFLEEIRKEKKISNELLSELLKDLTIKNENNGDILYSGYEIKNSIEMFINYVSQLIYKETARIYGEENIKKLKEIITSIDNIRGKVGFDSDGDKLEALMQYQTLNEYVFISFAKRGELDRKELEKFNI